MVYIEDSCRESVYAAWLETVALLTCWVFYMKTVPGIVQPSKNAGPLTKQIWLPKWIIKFQPASLARELLSSFSHTASYFLLDEPFSALANNCYLLLVIATAVSHCLYFKTSTWMSPAEAEQINMCVHLCKDLSKIALWKVLVNSGSHCCALDPFWDDPAIGLLLLDYTWVTSAQHFLWRPIWDTPFQ